MEVEVEVEGWQQSNSSSSREGRSSSDSGKRAAEEFQRANGEEEKGAEATKTTRL